MTMQELKIFEEKQIRTIWDEVQEKWYFCINDVIAALTDSKDPAEYFKKIRRRDSELDDFVRGTNCPPPPIHCYGWQKAFCKMYGFAESFTPCASNTIQESRTFQTLAGSGRSGKDTADAGPGTWNSAVFAGL